MITSNGDKNNNKRVSIKAVIDAYGEDQSDNTSDQQVSHGDHGSNLSSIYRQ